MATIEALTERLDHLQDSVNAALDQGKALDLQARAAVERTHGLEVQLREVQIRVEQVREVLSTYPHEPTKVERVKELGINGSLISLAVLLAELLKATILGG